MSSDKQPVKQALKVFYAGKSLSDAQGQSLQQILSSGFVEDSEASSKESENAKVNSQTNRVVKWLGSIAASFLVVLVMSYLYTPQVISAAYADIQKDKHLTTGLQLPMQQWLDENKITRVPAQYPVEMTKFCMLDQNLTLHMRISGKEQGEMNVFFHHGEQSLLWFDGSGELDDMKWKLLKVRENLTLVVLYTHDMREKSVQHILNEMLPELEV